jgi:hypothetical protein
MAAMRECLELFLTIVVRAPMPIELVATDAADRCLLYNTLTRSDTSAGLTGAA